MSEDGRLRRLLRRLIQPAETMDGFGIAAKRRWDNVRLCGWGTYEFRVALYSSLAYHQVILFSFRSLHVNEEKAAGELCRLSRDIASDVPWR